MNKNTAYQNLWDEPNTVLRSIVTAVNVYIKKRLSQVNNITNHFKKLAKENQTKFKTIRKKEIVNTIVEINRE
jgi:hypothetical protein